MKHTIIIYAAFVLLFMVSCTSKKNPSDTQQVGMDDVTVTDSMHPDMPPPPPDSGRFDGHRPPPPPPHGKGRPPLLTVLLRIQF